MRVQINAANLNHGGAVAVAANFIENVPAVWDSMATAWITYLEILVSPRVAEEIDDLDLIRRLDRVDVVVSSSRLDLKSLLWSRPDFDVRFTIFGPEYLGRKAAHEVVGFADGTIVRAWHSPEPGTKKRTLQLPLRSRITGGAKRMLLARNYDTYVVQTSEMADSLRSLVPSRPVHVVPNVVSGVFTDPTRWSHVPLPDRQPQEIRLFYPARGYVHKNHSYLPLVSRAFEETFGIPLTFVTTLRSEEMQRIFPDPVPCIINVGEISRGQCAYLYEKTDALFFPSLNETFSSSPIEAMTIGKPVIALDLPFMNEMLGGNCWYVPAENAQLAAEVVWSVFNDQNSLSERTVQSQIWVQRFTSGSEQAFRYFSIMRDRVGTTNNRHS